MKKRWAYPGSLFVRRTPGVRKPTFWARARRVFRPLRFLRGVCTLLGAMILISATTSAIFTAFLNQPVAKPLPGQMILTLRIDKGLSEMPESGSLLAGLQDIANPVLSVHDMIVAIDAARTDNRVKALAVSIESGAFNVSHVQELRAALARFRSGGKPAYVYSPSYAEAGGTMGAYYLASAFEQIWLQPVGFVSLPGYDARAPFFRAALAKIGITPHFYQRREYKGVMENVANDKMSGPGREMTESLLNDINDVIVGDIAADRKLNPAVIRKAIDRNIFTDTEALSARLVDRVDYADVMIAELRKVTGGNPDAEDIKLQPMGAYFSGMTLPVPPAEAPAVGIIYALGAISPGSSGPERGIAADRLASAIIKGMKDDGIKAIFLRVDSPGGSPTASETVRRAVERAVKKGKPVIVSMGAMAGSGGYWIIADATHIFALPSTLTGSIGVASGKFDAAGLMQKTGINWDGVQIGENAGLHSFLEPFSVSGDERMNAMMDSIYDSFILRVSNGRKMKPADVEKIAKGRVWTGRQAHERGLVDSLGGMEDALDYAARTVGAKDRFGIHLVELPRPRTPFDNLLELLNIEVMMERVVGAVVAMLQDRAGSAGLSHVTVRDPFLETRL